YTSRVSNFLAVTPFAYLRSPRGRLPHAHGPGGGVWMHARYLEDRGDRIVLLPAPLDRLAPGALLARVLAPIVPCCGLRAAWIPAGDDLSFVFGWGVTALLAGGIALVGLVGMARAPRVVERAVRMNLTERVLERPGSAVEVLRGVDAVRVRAGRWPWSGFSLELAHDDGRSTPLLNAPRGRGHELAKAAEHLAYVLDAGVEIAARAERDRPFIPRDPRLASALCYAPIDGLAQALAVYYLMTSIDPFVRFSAKQSLLMVPLELAGFLL